MTYNYLDDTDTLMSVLKRCITPVAESKVTAIVSAGGSSSVYNITAEIDAYDAQTRYSVRSLRVNALHAFELAYTQSEVGGNVLMHPCWSFL
jgi:hypothetical protein